MPATEIIMSDTFDRAFALTVGVEGGLTTDPKDRGNWTTGIIGKGECKGTKYGISAMSYPSLDIANLTLDQAKAIYQKDYWTAVRADLLPAPAAIVLFDYAVNSGPAGKIALMQTAAGVAADGDIGPATLAAIATRGGPKLAAEITARRMMALAALPTWKIYGLGWSRRMAAILAAAIEAEPVSPPAPATTTYISPMPPLETLKQAIREVNAEKVAE
jgi:lysozyme family protein